MSCNEEGRRKDPEYAENHHREASGYHFCQFGEFGGPDRIRTCDLLIKSQLLYQLSYGPARNSRYGQGRKMSNEQRTQRDHVVPINLFTYT